jgi:type I restriction enzyme S subunit
MMKKLLPEVCTIQYGFPFDSAKFSDSDGMPLIRIRDVVRGYSETYTTEEYKSEYIVHENDLLIGMDGEFNIAKWGKTPALLNQRVCRLAPKDSIDKDYLFYFMPIALKRIEEKTPFVTVKHLSAKELNKIEIPVLPLEEQRKIAETLSKVDELIAFRDQQLAKLDELVKARFVEMFGNPSNNSLGFPYEPLSNCLLSIENGKSFVCSNDMRQEENPAILKLSAVTYGVYQQDENKAILDSSMFVKSAEVHKGDLLFTRKNTPELVGMCAYVNDTAPNLMMPDLIFRLNTNEKINKIFLWKLINHEFFRGKIQNIATGSAKSMSNISKERLEKLAIILPPLHLQNDFAALVERVDQQKQTIQQSLEKLELMKKALMQEYFG